MLADPFAVTFTWDSDTNDPLTVRFTDTSKLSTTWFWSFGDGETSIDQNPVHTYQEPGVYVVRLTSLTGMIEPLQERSTETPIVVVTPTPTPTPPGAVTTTPTSTPIQSRSPVADFSFAPQSGPAQLRVEFEGQGYDPDGFRDVARMTWDFGDGSPTEDGQRVNHTFVEPDAYTVRLTVHFSGLTNFQKSYVAPNTSQVTATAEHTVQVEPARIVIDAVGDLRGGDTLDLTGSTNLAPGTDLLVEVFPGSYRPVDAAQAGEFSGATGTTRVIAGGGTPNTFRFTVDTSGFGPDTYTAAVQAIGADATATTTFTLVERDTETPTANTTTSTTTPMTYPATPDATLTTYLTTLTPTTTSVETSPPGSPPAAAFTWSSAATNGLRIQFTDTSTGDVTARRWEFGDKNVSLDTNPFHIYPGPGTYTVHLAVEGPGGVSSAHRAIAVGGTDTPPVRPTVTATTVHPTVTATTVVPTVTGGQGDDAFPWWIAAIAAVGLLAGGAALVKFGPEVSPPVKTVPGLTIEPRGRLQRPATGRETEIEIEVRGGIRRER